MQAKSLDLIRYFSVSQFTKVDLSPVLRRENDALRLFVKLQKEEYDSEDY